MVIDVTYILGQRPPSVRDHQKKRKKQNKINY